MEGGDSKSNPPPTSSTRTGDVDDAVCRGSGDEVAEAEEGLKEHTAAADVRAATLAPAFWMKDRLGVDDEDEDDFEGERAWHACK